MKGEDDAVPPAGSLRWHQNNHEGPHAGCAICAHQRGERTADDVVPFPPPARSRLTADERVRIAALEVARHVHPSPVGTYTTPDEDRMLLDRLLATGDVAAEWIRTGTLADVEDGTEADPAERA